jgi:predicted RNase H-like HicB family nuclease
MPEPYAEEYHIVIKVHLDGQEWGAVVGENPIEGVAGFGSTVNEAMADLVVEMEHYHRNWEEFAEEL